MRLGAMELRLLSDGLFKLDGGAMFGIVPKPLWEKTNPPDASNRIEMRAGVLLVRAGDRNVLVDTGLGGKLSEKKREIYAFEGPALIHQLADAGVARDDIDTVILTHLHLDHAGGCTTLDESGQAVPTFPKAEYVVQEKEWRAAHMESPLTKGSYIPADFEPLDESGQLKLIDGRVELADGVTAEWVGGHTPGHQVVFVESAGKTALFPGDLIPMSPHVRLPYIMAYDVLPMDLVEKKKELIERAVKEEWLMIWQHDPSVGMGMIRRDEGRVRVEAIQEGD